MWEGSSSRFPFFDSILRNFKKLRYSTPWIYTGSNDLKLLLFLEYIFSERVTMFVPNFAHWLLCLQKSCELVFGNYVSLKVTSGWDKITLATINLTSVFLRLQAWDLVISSKLFGRAVNKLSDKVRFYFEGRGAVNYANTVECSRIERKNSSERNSVFEQQRTVLS